MRTKNDYSVAVLIICLTCISIACAADPAQTEFPGTPGSQPLILRARLDQVYDEVLNLYRQDALFIDKLKLSQRRWHAYKDAHLEALYPAEDKNTAYGSAYGRCYRKALAMLTQHRIDQLRVWIKGRPEGDVCAGSAQR